MLCKAILSKQFTPVPMNVVKNRDLSLSALGLYCILTSLPDDWDISIEGLARLTADSKDKVRASVNMLEKAGYLERQKRRSDGKFVNSNYYLFD